MGINEITRKIFENQIVQSLLVIVVSYIFYLIINKALFKKNRIGKLSIGNSSETYNLMIRSAVKYAFIIIAVLLVLQVNGINVTSLLAGLGILGVAVGLALKDALQDIIKGFTILSDSYFKIGDVIKYKGIEGKVMVIGLKTTKIVDITNQNEVSIANRNIEQVEIVSNQLDIVVPIGYEESKEDVEPALKEIVEKIKILAKVKECKYIGINKFSDSNLDYLIRINCDPESKYQTKRDALVIVYDILSKYYIEIPYKQIDVHTK